MTKMQETFTLTLGFAETSATAALIREAQVQMRDQLKTAMITRPHPATCIPTG